MRRRKGEEHESSIGTVLDSLLAKFSVKQVLLERRLLERVEQRLGADFTRHMEPDRFQEGVLWCRVDSPAWAQQYTLLKTEILARLRAPGEADIADIRFAVGKLRRSAYISRVPGAGTEGADDVPLTAAEEAYRHQALANVSPELRESVERGLRQYLLNRRGRGEPRDGAGS